MIQQRCETVDHVGCWHGFHCPVFSLFSHACAENACEAWEETKWLPVPSHGALLGVSQ